MNKIKILMLVAESWRSDSAGGNVTDNHFSGMNADFAQIFTSADLPKNNTCHKYFQFTDSEIIKKFLLKQPVGHVLDINQISEKQINAEKNDRKLLDLFRILRLNFFYLIKSFIWRYSKWKTPALEKFILDFKPDVIFAPCYPFPFQLALTRYVKDLTGKKIVSYSSDDNYSLKQFSISPFFWVNRLWNRYCLKKTYSYYDLIYSMTKTEIDEISLITKKPMKILHKGIEITPFQKRDIKLPIKIIYAGGIYIDRWKVLARIGNVLKEINKNGIKIVLDIYTQNSLTKRQHKALNDGSNIFTHSAVDKDQLDILYKNSNIALHVESFSLKNRLKTRLSFSTKIIDCLGSGCAVIAVAWKGQGGLKYLKEQNAALCITDLSEIKKQLEYISDNPNYIDLYSKKAYDCVAKNHDIKKIRKDLYTDIFNLCSN